MFVYVTMHVCVPAYMCLCVCVQLCVCGGRGGGSARRQNEDMSWSAQQHFREAQGFALQCAGLKCVPLKDMFKS